MIGIPLGLFVGNAFEWFAHKHILHGLGKNPKSYWRMHWDHHKAARLNDFKDENYTQPLWRWNPHTKEALALVGVSALVTPLYPVAPFFTGTLHYCAINYYRKHKRCHLDPEWGKQNMPWHYDHHMAKDQNKNWCVTRPFFDYVMKTRIKSSLIETEKNIFGFHLA